MKDSDVLEFAGTMCELLSGYDDVVLNWFENYSYNAKYRYKVLNELMEMHLCKEDYKKLTDSQFLSLVKDLDLSYNNVANIFHMSSSTISSKAQRLGVRKKGYQNTSPFKVDDDYYEKLIGDLVVQIRGTV